MPNAPSESRLSTSIMYSLRVAMVSSSVTVFCARTVNPFACASAPALPPFIEEMSVPAVAAEKPYTSSVVEISSNLLPPFAVPFPPLPQAVNPIASANNATAARIVKSVFFIPVFSFLKIFESSFAFRLHLYNSAGKRIVGKNQKFSKKYFADSLCNLRRFIFPGQ